MHATTRINIIAVVRPQLCGHLRRFVLVCLVSLILTPYAAPDARQRLTTVLPPQEKRFALLIGVGTYENDIKPLRGPGNDVTLLKNALIKYAGFPDGNIFTLSSDSSDQHQKPTVTNIIRLLSQELRPKLPGGLLLVAFSGHGINKAFKTGNRVERVPLLLMYDSSLSPDYLLERYALPVTKLRSLLETTGASQILLFVDACQDDPDPSRPLSDNPMTPELKSNMQLRTQRLSGALVFFATRPPLRAYVGPRETGYFTEVLVDALAGKADKDKRNYTTLDRFVDYIRTTVVTETNGRQDPEANGTGYDEHALRVVDRTNDIDPSQGVVHKIFIRHTGTESACAKLPADAKLQITVGGTASTVSSAGGCQSSYFWPNSLVASSASLTLTSARGIVIDNPAAQQDRAATTWNVDVHYSGPAVRISEFEINMNGISGAGFDYRHVLSEQVLVLSGLLSAHDETKYTNRLTLVETGKAAQSPLADQLEYLDATNSVESVWGETKPGTTGSPELNLHVVIRAHPGSSGLINVKLPLADSARAYQSVSEATKAVLLLGLLEDAKQKNNQQAATFLANQALLCLEGIEQLGQFSSDLVAVQRQLEIEKRAKP